MAPATAALATRALGSCLPLLRPGGPPSPFVWLLAAAACAAASFPSPCVTVIAPGSRLALLASWRPVRPSAVLALEARSWLTCGTLRQYFRCLNRPAEVQAVTACSPRANWSHAAKSCINRPMASGSSKTGWQPVDQVCAAPQSLTITATAKMETRAAGTSHLVRQLRGNLPLQDASSVVSVAPAASTSHCLCLRATAPGMRTARSFILARDGHALRPISLRPSSKRARRVTVSGSSHRGRRVRVASAVSCRRHAHRYACILRSQGPSS